MEDKLKLLFDYQRFEKNQSLENLIQDTESYYGRELSDEEMKFVAAAGELKTNRRTRDININAKNQQ